MIIRIVSIKGYVDIDTKKIKEWLPFKDEAKPAPKYVWIDEASNYDTQ